MTDDIHNHDDDDCAFQLARIADALEHIVNSLPEPKTHLNQRPRRMR